MTDNTSEFVETPDEAADFYVDSPKGVVREEATATGSVSTERGTEAPQQKIGDFRDIARTDPHANEGVGVLLDWILGDNYNISPRSVGERESEAEQIERLQMLLKTSRFWSVANEWVRRAIVDGHAFMELVVEDGEFKPKVLPTQDMRRKTDKYGVLEYYELETPSGSSEDQFQQYDPNEVAELYFTKHPEDDFGRSQLEAVAEQADMLRDMEIDYGRFIATKAYPPILWRLGTENRNWTEEQINNWMDGVESIGPDTMLAAPHDVETDIVGTTSTSSSAGAMRLEETFKHLENRVVTGLGVPRILMNMESSGQGEATVAMPSFKRRVSRFQEQVKNTIEQQIFRSLLKESIATDSEQAPVLPEFQFGEHSSAEKRLELDKLLKLFNNGLLTPEAFAERAGLEIEEIPEFWDDFEHVEALLMLSGAGDNVQNPEGGSPTDTEGGAESSGGEVVSRQDPGADSSNGRNKRAITEEEG